MPMYVPSLAADLLPQLMFRRCAAAIASLLFLLPLLLCVPVVSLSDCLLLLLLNCEVVRTLTALRCCTA